MLLKLVEERSLLLKNALLQRILGGVVDVLQIVVKVASLVRIVYGLQELLSAELDRIPTISSIAAPLAKKAMVKVFFGCWFVEARDVRDQSAHGERRELPLKPIGVAHDVDATSREQLRARIARLVQMMRPLSEDLRQNTKTCGKFLFIVGAVVRGAPDFVGFKDADEAVGVRVVEESVLTNCVRVVWKRVSREVHLTQRSWDVMPEFATADVLAKAALA